MTGNGPLTGLSRPSILGAILAGGQSSRFGSDKAMALLDGRSLLSHAVEALSSACDHVVVLGRSHDTLDCLPDWPQVGMGPLAGLAAALRFARGNNYSAVLSIGVDLPGLPPDLVAKLSPAPACLASQPVIGLWPSSAASAAEIILSGSGRHSMFAFAEAIGARFVRDFAAPANINFPEDLIKLS